MTNRDRLFAMGLAAAAILAAVWFLVVVPERKQAAELAEQVAVAHQALDSADEKLNGARAAQTGYENAYASVVRMGEAVPPSDQVPSLVYEIDQLSHAKHVDFRSITTSNSASTNVATSSSSSSPGGAVATGGFTKLPFTFTFEGTYFDLERLLSKLQGLAVQTASGDVQISGRLLTVQSADLTVSGEDATSRRPILTGTIDATAYVLPGGQSLTNGATPSGPPGAPTQTVTSTPSPPSTPTAVTQVTP